MFLLYADDQSQCHRISQKSAIQSEFTKLFGKQASRKQVNDGSSAVVTSNKENDLFHELRRKNALLEALCIIQVKNLIRKLGLDYTELEQRYSSSNQYDSLNIHRMVKLLYFVCEQLTVNEGDLLINFMTTKHPWLHGFRHSEHLEIHMMQWLSEDIITVGKREGESSPCNLDLILQFLEQNEMSSLKDTVTNAINIFNGTVTKAPIGR